MHKFEILSFEILSGTAHFRFSRQNICHKCLSSSEIKDCDLLSCSSAASVDVSWSFSIQTGPIRLGKNVRRDPSSRHVKNSARQSCRKPGKARNPSVQAGKVDRSVALKFLLRLNGRPNGLLIITHSHYACASKIPRVIFGVMKSVIVVSLQASRRLKGDWSFLLYLSVSCAVIGEGGGLKTVVQHTCSTSFKIQNVFRVLSALCTHVAIRMYSDNREAEAPSVPFLIYCLYLKWNNISGWNKFQQNLWSVSNKQSEETKNDLLSAIWAKFTLG